MVNEVSTVLVVVVVLVVVISLWLPSNISWSVSISFSVTVTSVFDSVISETTFACSIQVAPVDSVLKLSI